MNVYVMHAAYYTQNERKKAVAMEDYTIKGRVKEGLHIRTAPRTATAGCSLFTR